MTTKPPEEIIPILTEMAHSLSRAAQAEFAGDHDTHLEHLDAAANYLGFLFHHAPQEIPVVTAALGAMTPVVRPPDLRSVCSFVQAEQQALSDTYSPVLHPDCADWIQDAADEHNANPLTVSAWLCIEPELGNMHRAGGLPVSDPLRGLAGQATWQDIAAAADVSERCSRAISQNVDNIDELLRLLGPEFRAGKTMDEAAELLTGPDRIRIEELMAEMPSVVTLTGTP